MEHMAALSYAAGLVRGDGDQAHHAGGVVLRFGHREPLLDLFLGHQFFSLRRRSSSAPSHRAMRPRQAPSDRDGEDEHGHEDDAREDVRGDFFRRRLSSWRRRRHVQLL
eukprot:CAMPEP_0117521544 /NCGR_PEP_ID=MMETSP0784-20121206/33739_1 /TAXON_ID=39447 /ORGANISM="" /LENGTH=108 /DNA_ID=CAMNT_0005317573 /DNA_START=339 /DNA_END=665 /DNA_ORIENTATION=+